MLFFAIGHFRGPQIIKATMETNIPSNKLYESVIRGGFCIGCGACAGIPGSPFKISLDPYGRFQACEKTRGEAANYTGIPRTQVCPFSDESRDENDLSTEFLAPGQKQDARLGKFSRLLAGYVQEGTYRADGSSGGIISWLLCELLQHGDIDGVVHVKAVEPASDADGLLFRYGISRQPDDVKAGAKSRYYAVEMSEVITQVQCTPGRYAIVGVPCFIKAIRLLMRDDPVLRERIKYCIAIVCGHLKSTKFAELLAMQMGVPPERVIAINFRQKFEEGGASQYGVSVTDQNRESAAAVRPAHTLFGSDWGMGFFKYQACDFCDDVFGETADLTAGDAWYTKFANDPRGANVVVVRNKHLESLLCAAIDTGRIVFDELSPDQIARTQQSGLRHRREGLSFRLHLWDEAGLWRPRKRVAARAWRFKRRFQQLHSTRMLLANESHSAFSEAVRQNDFAVYSTRMQPLVHYYRMLYKDPDRLRHLWHCVVAGTKKTMKRLLLAVGLGRVIARYRR